MPISGVHKTTAYDNVDRTVYTTASLTAVANRLYLIWISSTAAATASPTIASVSGGGLGTWIEVATVTAGVRRISLYRAMLASPGAGAVISIDYTGSAQPCIGAAWSIWEYDGISISGTMGADAIVQSDTDTGTATATGAGLSLAPFAKDTNRPAVGVTIAANEAIVAESGYIASGTAGGTAPIVAINTAWQPGIPDISPSMSWTSSVAYRAIAVELNAFPTRVIATGRNIATGRIIAAARTIATARRVI